MFRNLDDTTEQIWGPKWSIWEFRERDNTVNKFKNLNGRSDEFWDDIAKQVWGTAGAFSSNLMSCLVHLKKPKTFQNFLSHRILRHMHWVLNIDENKN